MQGVFFLKKKNTSEFLSLIQSFALINAIKVSFVLSLSQENITTSVYLGANSTAGAEASAVVVVVATAGSGVITEVCYSQTPGSKKERISRNSNRVNIMSIKKRMRYPAKDDTNFDPFP